VCGPIPGKYQIRLEFLRIGYSLRRAIFSSESLSVYLIRGLFTLSSNGTDVALEEAGKIFELLIATVIIHRTAVLNFLFFVSLVENYFPELGDLPSLKVITTPSHELDEIPF
jgi:hypothetical protein